MPPLWPLHKAASYQIAPGARGVTNLWARGVTNRGLESCSNAWIIDELCNSHGLAKPCTHLVPIPPPYLGKTTPYLNLFDGRNSVLSRHYSTAESYRYLTVIWSVNLWCILGSFGASSLYASCTHSRGGRRPRTSPRGRVGCGHAGHVDEQGLNVVTFEHSEIKQGGVYDVGRCYFPLRPPGAEVARMVGSPLEQFTPIAADLICRNVGRRVSIDKP